MPDWDSESPELATNLASLIANASSSAFLRGKLTVDTARQWHKDIMMGLDVPDTRWVGAFRGEPGLEDLQVKIDSTFGAPADSVAVQLKQFESTLQKQIKKLDHDIPPGHEPTASQIYSVLEVCAWAHAEWIRVHPFANGSGRTARIWANSVAMRYGLPAFIRLRPRPGSGYGEAGAQAMKSDWQPTLTVFLRLFKQAVEGL